MPSTIYRRTTMLRGWIRWCTDHGIDLADATAEDVQRFIDAKHVGARTRYTWISAISCFSRWAVQTGHLPHDPTLGITRPKLRRTLPRPIADEDLAVAISMADPQMRCWLILAAYAGLRCAEIAVLCRDDILTADELLRVVGKGGKERLVPMHPLVLEALAAWPKPRQNRPLFQRPAGGAWPPALLSRTASVYLHDIGIDATMHQLRHWFATNTLRRSGNLRTVQGLLGHSSPTTTAIYTQFCDEDARAAVRAIGRPAPQTTLF